MQKKGRKNNKSIIGMVIALVEVNEKILFKT